jgi:cobalt-precorrin-5B (C1)-methyltransferase
VVLSTGGKSERFARRFLGHLAEESFVQIADFYGFSLEAAVKLGFDKVTHSVFIGKLVKMAMGLHYTHASSANMDLGVLTDIAAEIQGSEEVTDRLAKANTARHALEIMQETGTADQIIPMLSRRAVEASRSHSQDKLDIHLFLFDYHGQVIHRC